MVFTNEANLISCEMDASGAQGLSGIGRTPKYFCETPTLINPTFRAPLHLEIRVTHQ